MKITGKKSISCIIKLLLQIIFFIGIILLIILPIGAIYMVSKNPMLSVFLCSYPLFIYLTGFPAIILVYQFIRLFDSLKNENPFIEQNIKALQMASYTCAIISVIYLALLILSICFQIITYVIFAGILFIVFLIGWIGCYILSVLFRQAVEYKKESDLTI